MSADMINKDFLYIQMVCFKKQIPNKKKKKNVKKTNHHIFCQKAHGKLGNYGQMEKCRATIKQ